MKKSKLKISPGFYKEVRDFEVFSLSLFKFDWLYPYFKICRIIHVVLFSYTFFVYLFYWNAEKENSTNEAC